MMNVLYILLTCIQALKGWLQRRFTDTLIQLINYPTTLTFCSFIQNTELWAIDSIYLFDFCITPYLRIFHKYDGAQHFDEGKGDPGCVLGTITAIGSFLQDLGP